jgi:hypothetical protein
VIIRQVCFRSPGSRSCLNSCSRGTCHSPAIHTTARSSSATRIVSIPPVATSLAGTGALTRCTSMQVYLRRVVLPDCRFPRYLSWSFLPRLSLSPVVVIFHSVPSLTSSNRVCLSCSVCRMFFGRGVSRSSAAICRSSVALCAVLLQCLSLVTLARYIFLQVRLRWHPSKDWVRVRVRLARASAMRHMYICLHA